MGRKRLFSLCGLSFSSSPVEWIQGAVNVTHKKPFDCNTDPGQSKWFMVYCLNCCTKVEIVREQKKQKNNTRTDILAFSPHLCCKPSLVHSIILTLALRRIALFLLSRWQQGNVWYLEQEEMLALKENVSVHCKLVFLGGFFSCL